MSSIQIVPDDVGVAAAQIIADAVGNFSLHNRLNSSDLENLALEGAKEISTGLKDVASVIDALNIPITLLLYAISIALIIWIVLTVSEKVIVLITYFSGNRRKGRGWGRGPCSSCCNRFKFWCLGSSRSQNRTIYTKAPNLENGKDTEYINMTAIENNLLSSRIPPINQEDDDELLAPGESSS